MTARARAGLWLLALCLIPLAAYAAVTISGEQVLVDVDNDGALDKSLNDALDAGDIGPDTTPTGLYLGFAGRDVPTTWEVAIEDFSQEVADQTAFEAKGWSFTQIGTPGTSSFHVDHSDEGQGIWEMDIGDVADTGYRMQFIEPTPEDASDQTSPHQIIAFDRADYGASSIVMAMRFTGSYSTPNPGAFHCKGAIGIFDLDANSLIDPNGEGGLILDDDGAGFHFKEDGTVDAVVRSEDGTPTETSTGFDFDNYTLQNNSSKARDPDFPTDYFVFGIRIDFTNHEAGTGVTTFYIDDVLVATINETPGMQGSPASTPQNRPTIELINDSTGHCEIKVDYILTAMERADP